MGRHDSLLQRPCETSTEPSEPACRKSLFGVASIFVNLSETMAELGFLVRLSRRHGCCSAHHDPGRVHCQHALAAALTPRGAQCRQAFAAALVAFAGLYLRHRFTINPRAVYRQAMVKLNTSPSVLEV